MTLDLSIAIPIASALVTAIGVLVTAIKYLSTAKDKAEQGRLDDLRASAQVVRETQEKALPLLERVAIELRIMNERRARRHTEADSEPPRPSTVGDDLENTLTRMRRAEEDAARAREELAASLSRGGASKGP